MSECKLDHNIGDVHKKLAEQAPFLPSQIASSLLDYLQVSLTQESLNEVFHYLKKYDLASLEERSTRDEKIMSLIRKRPSST